MGTSGDSGRGSGSGIRSRVNTGAVAMAGVGESNAMVSFRSWLSKAGVFVNEDVVELREKWTEKGRRHVAVFARRECENNKADDDLKEKDKDKKKNNVVAVAKIPKSACLTRLTASCASRLEEHEVGGPLALIIAVMHERLLGDKSEFAPYLNLIPQREDGLPVFWPEDDLKSLRGTSLEHKVKQDTQLMSEDYEAIVRPFFEEEGGAGAGEGPTEEDFAAAASVVASRAFRVDDRHGDGMVPVADLFNHRTDAEHVRIYGEDEEDAEKESQDNGVLEMLLIRPVCRGGEVFNTFGVHGNQGLVHKYGFAELDNGHTVVDVPEEVVAGVLGEEEYLETVAALGLGSSLAQRSDDEGDDADGDDDGDGEDGDEEDGDGDGADEEDEDGGEIELASEDEEGEDGLRPVDLEVAPDGSLSLDLRRVLGCDESGQPPADDSDAVEFYRVVMEVLSARLWMYPPLEGGGGEEAGETTPSSSDEDFLKRNHAPCVAGGGTTYVGVAAALALRVAEKRALERAFVRAVEGLRAVGRGGGGVGGGGGKRRKVVSGTIYDPTVVLNLKD